MNTKAQTHHSGAWVAFTYASFIGAVAMVGLGILFMPVEIWVKGYLAMGAALRKSQQRLSELERGRRIALAAESVRRLKTGGGLAGPSGPQALADAEATLRRLRERQAEDAAADNAYAAFDLEAKPASVAERLEAAGFGKVTRPTAADVLARLRQKTAATPST